MLCASLIPAAPPSSIQKAIIKMGASGGGRAGVGPGVSGPSCFVSSINEVPLQPLRGSEHSALTSEKKPAWSNTQRDSTTPAYSSNGPPGTLGCPSASLPTTSIRAPDGARFEACGVPSSHIHCTDGGGDSKWMVVIVAQSPSGPATRIMAPRSPEKPEKPRSLLRGRGSDYSGREFFPCWKP